VRDASALKIAVKLMIFPTPIRPNNLNFGVEKAFNMSLKSIENLLNIGFVLKKVNPTKTRIVINKTDIVFETTRGGHSRTPNIGMNQFKRHSGNTMRQIIW
jgi:hypothetical protein